MMALWSNDAFVFVVISVGGKLKQVRCRSECTQAMRRWYWTHTKETELLENDTHLRKKLISVMRQQKFCNVAEKQRHWRTRGQKNLPPGKIAKPPIHQERTKTQNCTKVADTTKK